MNGQGLAGRKWLLVAGLGVGAAVAGAVTGGPSLARDDGDRAGESQPSFSDRSIKGYWGYSTSFGTILPPIVPTPLPTTAIGRIHFDGRGGCAVNSIVNLNGESQAASSSSCSYQVNSDGTGSAQALFPGTPITEPVPVSFVIVDGGREIRFLNTKFIVATFTARRQ